MTWKSVGITNTGAVLQQRYIPEQDPSKEPSERRLVPTDEHRTVPLKELAERKD